MNHFRMKILAALSGGIDSSVVAHMLKSQGHELIGVRFALWSDPLAPALAQILPSKCCNAQTAARTASVCKTLSIPLHVIDLQDEFKKAVVDPFLEGHARGITPNPCIGCNRQIKFGKLLSLMKEFGCERLATGHYARTAKERMPDGSERQVLLEAVDFTKDQSYYLHRLSQEQLRSALFPLGAMKKSEVFALAKEFKVPFDEEYRESQDLCFFPEKTPQEFLKRHLASAIRPGDIVRRDGTVVGSHTGLPLYTVGQRRGLKIGGLKIPLEVVAKDAQKNQLIVDEQGRSTTQQIHVAELRWVSWSPDERTPVDFDCRTRSLGPRVSGKLIRTGETGIFRFKQGLPPQAPGQSLVLYRGEEVVGGGVIEG